MTSLSQSGRSTQTLGGVVTQQTPNQSTGATVVQPSVQVSGSYQGSTPGPKLPSGTVTLSLVEAVRRGLELNLGR
jgi:hypothetical protein